MISAKQVKELRDITGAGMMDCKKALQAAGGDLEKAQKILREKGLAKAAKKGSRTASEGIIDSYIHLGGKIGVLIEVNCETDFVARNEEFRSFVRDLCLHIAATNPVYLTREQVPTDVIEKEKEILKKQALNEGKPEKIVEKIVDGRMEKFYAENCLMEQPFVKDPDITIEKLLMEKIAKIGENIVIRRYVRFELGEEMEK
ncbi:MAG: translation elongation factor Ts [Dethiobacteria bacterium]